MGTRKERPLERSTVNGNSGRGTKWAFHLRELSIERGNDLANGLGGTCAGGNDVIVNSTSTAPVFGRWAVNGLLGGGGSMNGAHETFDDAKFVVDNLGEWCKAVSGAGGVGDDAVFGVVCIKIDTTDKHGCICRGSRDDDLLGTTLEVSSSPGGRYDSSD